MRPTEGELNGVSAGKAAVAGITIDLQYAGKAARGRKRLQTRIHSRRRQGEPTVKEVWMGDRPRVCDLREDASARAVHRVRYGSPSVRLFLSEQARHVDDADCLRARCLVPG